MASAASPPDERSERAVSEAYQTLPPTLAEVHEYSPRYRPVLARTLLAAGFLVLGLVFRFALGLPLSLAYFALVLVWVTTFVFFYRVLDIGPEAAAYFPLRVAFFSLEVLFATGIAHVLGASSWLATLFLLFPAIEWNMMFPGSWGLIGSGLAVMASGALVAGEALGFVPPQSLFQSVETVYREPSYAIGAFLVSAFVIISLSIAVGNYAEGGRRKSRELNRLSRHYQELSDDLKESHGQLEAAYGELRNAQAELVGSARLATLGQLVAGIAHEINTPLGALNSNHDVVHRALDRLQEILADEVVDEHELDDVRRIVKAVDGVQHTNDLAVQRMVQLVDSLRSFGRPDRSEIDRVDLHEGIESALAILSHELGEVDVRRDYGELPDVECYPNQMNQVFMNILVNACQAMPDGGTITITTRTDGNDVVISVADTGVGIAEDNLARIFEPGFTTKGNRVGMGLGLLIAQQIVDRHAGRIAVDSTVGGGTTFHVRVPIRLRAETQLGVTT